MNNRNRVANCHNPFQDQKKFPRALCVCSAGLLRSPTLAFVLGEMGFNTRAAGSVPAFALVPVDEVLLAWADVVFFVNEENFEDTSKKFDLKNKKVITLNIPDRFNFRDPELIKIIHAQLQHANVTPEFILTL